jgi:hypothetical protein
MKVSVEVLIEIDDPARLVAFAREQYRRYGGAIDVEGLSTKECLEIADSTRNDARKHPRYIKPESAIPDAEMAALSIVENVFNGRGGEVVSSTSRVIRSTPWKLRKAKVRPRSPSGRRKTNRGARAL